jgi:hypothetical protein
VFLDGRFALTFGKSQLHATGLRALADHASLFLGDHRQGIS